MKLFPDQLEGKKAIARSIRAGNKRIGFSAPCSYGKTVLMADIVNGALAKDNRVWVIVDSVELIDQTRETLEAYDVQSGVIQGYHEDTDYSRPVQVVTAQTITRRWDKFTFREHLLPQIVLIDEFHVKHRAHKELMEKLKNVIVIGFSATPTTSSLGLTYDDLVIGSTVRQLLSEKRIKPIVGYACDTPDMSDVKTSNGDYQIGQTEKKVNTVKLRGKLVENWVKLGKNRKTIIFCVNVQHAIDVANEFYDNGIATAEVDGKTHKDMRKEIIEDFRNGEYKVLVSCLAFIKGFNVKDIGCIVDAQPTKSISRHIQKLGRGMRLDGVHDECIVIDSAGNLLRNGFPEEFEPKELCTKESGSKSDQKEKEERLPIACPTCGKVNPVGTVRCECGYEYKRNAHVENDDSILKKIKRKLTPAEKRNKEQNMVEKQEFFSCCLEYCSRKNKKMGFAFHLYEDYYGVSPTKLEKVKAGYVTKKVQLYINSKNIRYAKRRKK